MNPLQYRAKESAADTARTVPVGQEVVHVYTLAELRDPTKRPRRISAGHTIRVAAAFTRPRGPEDQDGGRYRVPSPCCGIVTTVPHWSVVRMLNGTDKGWMECGKTFWHKRGRGTGCRARYRLYPVPAEPRPEHFDLTWTGA
jgi:hypothetical protein